MRSQQTSRRPAGAGLLLSGVAQALDGNPLVHPGWGGALDVVVACRREGGQAWEVPFNWRQEHHVGVHSAAAQPRASRVRSPCRHQD